MKVFKILSMALILLFLGAHSIDAQSTAIKISDKQKEEITKSVQAFDEILGLSDEQKPEFEAVTKKYAKQMIALKNSDSGKLKKYRTFKAIQKNKNAEMEKLLSKDQYEVYLKKQEDLQKKMKEKRG